MKTTSYEISKQLAEIGFKRYYDQYWAYNSEEGDVLHRNYFESNRMRYEYPSYDLETLLEALPSEIKIGKCFYSLNISKANIYYFDTELHFWKQENESLADAVAKMWLKLKQEGLV